MVFRAIRTRAQRGMTFLSSDPAHPRATLAATLLGSSLAFVDGSVVYVALPVLGAALLRPTSLAILGSEVNGEARGRAIGTWAAVGALAGALGPVLGGWLVDSVGWRVIFLINVPLAVGAGYLAWRYVRERTESQNPAPLDLCGAALATVALGLLT